MQLFVQVLHIFLCLSLILIIILQPGKGDVAAAFGAGSGNQNYAPRTPGHFLGHATTIVAFMFMVTSVTLAVYSTERMVEGAGKATEGLIAGEDDEGNDLGADLVIEPDEPELEPIELPPPSGEPIDAQPAEVPADGVVPVDDAPEDPAVDKDANPEEGQDTP